MKAPMFCAVGLFADLERKAGPHVPHLADTRDQLDPADVPSTLAHLRADVGIIDYMEMCVDPFDSSQAHPGGSSLMSDGYWVWRVDLASTNHADRAIVFHGLVRRRIPATTPTMIPRPRTRHIFPSTTPEVSQ